jgi:hypothetical protein
MNVLSLAEGLGLRLANNMLGRSLSSWNGHADLG